MVKFIVEIEEDALKELRESIDDYEFEKHGAKQFKQKNPRSEVIRELFYIELGPFNVLDIRSQVKVTEEVERR